MAIADSYQPPASRPTWAEVSLPNLNHNYRTIKASLKPGSSLMALIKANAYGHGAIECARALKDQADCFGVALIEEGLELRDAGVAKPIFCLGGIWRGQGELAIEHDLTTVVHRLDQAEELNARAKESNRIVGYHLKVDTGLGRLGVPLADLSAFSMSLRGLANIRMDGLMTHFAEADANRKEFTSLQISRFEQALTVLKGQGFEPQWRHLANSAGIHSYPEAHGNMARAGAAMYGFTRDVIAAAPAPFDVRPVLSIHTRIVQLKNVPPDSPLGYGRSFTTKRESRIATLPIGYADGLRRLHSNNGNVLVAGARAPIVGRISMDLTICDVTDVPGAAVGDEVIILGRQGDERISAEDLGEQIGTISYEIACGFSPRIPRVYIY